MYYRIVNVHASEEQRLRVGRAVIGIAVVIAGIFGIYPPGFVSQVVAFAFGLAAASFFPAIVLGIFSKRVGTVPAVAGMIAGIGITSFYIIGTVFFDMDRWTLGFVGGGINPQGFGTVGMLINFAVTIALTPFFPTPSDETKDLIESIRQPEDAGPGLELENVL